MNDPTLLLAEAGIELIRNSVRAALKSPLGLLVLLYGAFALFNLIRDWYQIPLAPLVVSVVEFYRRTVGPLFSLVTAPSGVTLSPFQQDIVVLWISAGRIVSRSYVLLTEETHSPRFEYRWFTRWPFLPLTKLNRWFGHISQGRAYRVGLGLSSLLVTMAWPLVAWPFLIDPTVHKRERWRVHTGGTPHPSDPSVEELPPLGDELKPKFSREESSTQPHYHAWIVMLTCVAIQAVFVCSLVAGNMVLRSMSSPSSQDQSTSASHPSRFANTQHNHRLQPTAAGIIVNRRC